MSCLSISAAAVSEKILSCINYLSPAHRLTRVRIDSDGSLIKVQNLSLNNWVSRVHTKSDR
jgi:hypothetical protein